MRGLQKTKWYFYKLLLTARTEINTFIICTLGVTIYTVGVVGFVLPYNFPDAGVMGISLLLKYTMGFSPAITNLVINVALLIWGVRYLSKRFVIWTIYNIILLTFLLEAMSGITFPHVSDMFLVSVAGGLIKGLGIGMVFRTGGSSGGLDVVVSVLRKRMGIEVGKYSFYINLVILGAATGVVGLEKVLFGLVACFISGQTMDNVLSSFDKRRLVFVITPMGNQGPILEYIALTLNKGATLFDSRGGFTHEERATMMCLLTPRQTMELKRYLAMNFPSTFLVVSEASEVLGNGFKRWKNI